MTKIFLFEKNGIIYACQIKGHSGFDEKGKDIVCSAISAASQMALVGLQEVLGLKVESKMTDGFLSFKVLEGYEKKEVQTIFQSLKVFLEGLQKDYAKYVKMEVKKDVF